MDQGHEPGCAGAVPVITEEVSPSGRSLSECFLLRIGTQIRTPKCPKTNHEPTGIKYGPLFEVLFNNEFWEENATRVACHSWEVPWEWASPLTLNRGLGE